MDLLNILTLRPRSPVPLASLSPAEVRKGDKTASDHFPVIAELSYEPQIRHEQERPAPEPQDHAEAERKIEATAAD